MQKSPESISSMKRKEKAQGVGEGKTSKVVTISQNIVRVGYGGWLLPIISILQRLRQEEHKFQALSRKILSQKNQTQMTRHLCL